MSFNLFSAPSKDDIKVGYIDPQLGYVNFVSICEANSYAKDNPGTTFIFIDGNNVIRYLNINEVNKLSTVDLVSSSGECGGVQTYKVCGPPRIQFFGGDGIGAAGNPIVGRDGSLLAVDVVRGGHGYKYPPIVAAKDDCLFGSGTVLTAVLGEVADQIEVFDGEEDFEDYEICEDTDVGYGRRYGPDGEDIGPWEPQAYTKIGADPIQREIEIFQKAIQKPFWTSRKTNPREIVSDDGEYYNKYDVTHPAWGEFMNKYAISPVKPSDTPGTDEAAKVFTFEWEEFFPISGEYIFRGNCDNRASVYVDGNIVGELNQFKENPKPIQKTIQEGSHVIRVDLVNTPIYETKVIPGQPSSSMVDVNFAVYGQGAYRDLSFVFTAQDGTHSFVINTVSKNRETRNDRIKVKPNIKYNVVAKETSRKYKSVEQGLIKNGTKTKEGGKQITGNKIFADYIRSGNDNDDIQVTAGAGTFTASYNGKTGGRSTYILTYEVSAVAAGSAPPPAPAPAPAPAQVTKERTIEEWVQVDNVFVPPITRAYSFAEGSRQGQRGERGGQFTVNASELSYHRYNEGTFYKGKRIRSGGDWNDTNPNNNYIKWDDDTRLTLGKYYPDKDKRFGIAVWKKRSRKVSDVPVPAAPAPAPTIITAPPPPIITQVVSPKSWNENPMGISLSIDAPKPPIPQEQPPVQEGRCPPNPIWSTRFPKSAQTWYPVRYSNALREAGIIEWSNFLNRYAISPVPPLNTPGSDGSGITHRNSWQIDIPYDGFYKFAVQRDETARIYVDGKLAFDVKTAGDMIWKDFRNKPKFQKIFISKGRHTISIELENGTRETKSYIDTKIFSTNDWAGKLDGPEEKIDETVEVDFTVYGQGAYRDLSFLFTSEDGKDSFSIKGAASNKATRKEKIKVRTNINYKVVAKETSRKYNSVEQGLIKNGTKSKEAGEGSSNKIFADYVKSGNDNDDIQVTAGAGTFTSSNKRRAKGGRNTYDLVFKVSAKSYTPANTQAGTTSQTKGGVTYSGPKLFKYKDKRWGKYMNDTAASPKVFNSISQPESPVIGKYTLKWTNVNFPENGIYKFNFQADNIGIFKLDGKEIARTTDFTGEKIQFTFNASAGKRTIEIELENVRSATNNDKDTVFEINPMGAALYISRDIVLTETNKTSWTQNPIAISAILIPPPCAKKIGGRGVVEKVIVQDPGNGYLSEGADSTLPPSSEYYPVTLVLDEIIVTNPGINYRCGEDVIKIVPDNGAVLDYTCDTFGRIDEVKILNPGVGFDVYPRITIEPPEGQEPTGVNAEFVPVFKVIRDPVQLVEDQIVKQKQLIQVTDLVGLKQTGYVDGRAYYGAVYYDEGVRYAGYYKTVGTQIRVYDTLQESITARVTTAPSAIQRSGTDIRSNNPRLNIPGTPETTTEQP